MDKQGRAPAAIATVLAVVLAVASGCAAPGREPVAEPDVLLHAVQPDFVFGTDGGRGDTLAATVVTDAQAFWARTYPRLFDEPWRDLDGGFFSVDTTDTGADPPPCTSEVADVEGNAYYCGTVDAIVWDRSALLPVLREHYGAAAVAVVLAHEMGHAVQHRRGAGDPSDSPAFAEIVADCYSGAYTRWVVAGHSNRLRITEEQLDGAMRALARFRDPVGTSSSAASAHGTAYDRVSAFQDGYRQGAGRCGKLTPDRRVLTSERPHMATGEIGNQSPEDVIRSRADGLDTYFSRVLARHGQRWKPPHIDRSGARCSQQDSGSPAITYCASTNSLTVDRRELARLNHAIGDQATATILASRYARAALHQLDRSRHRNPAGTAACLTGAHTGWLLHGNGIPMTAGDLDEAVSALLSGEAVTRPGAVTGWDALSSFRTGVRSGARACGR